MGIDSLRKTNAVIGLAKRVKDNEHALREIALVFFILAMFTGVIWIMGNDVEPIAFVLGSICTLLYVSPKLARYVIPDRKPVRHMNYDEILDFIRHTDANLDWKWIETNWAEEAFLKEDPRLRIRVRYDETGMYNRSFTESWMTAFTDQAANSYWFDLSYDHALIDRFILVSVDGGKAELPMPETGSLVVEPLNYKVAQIFDQHNTLDQYMGKAGLRVKQAQPDTGDGSGTQAGFP